jgi:hypothetical protein
MKVIAAVLTLLLFTGCSTTTSEYYEAVENTARANAQAAQAKFDALAAIADSAKTMARYNSQVDLARISADAATQEALYGSFVSMGETTATVASNIDYTPFVDGMVTLGTTGMDNLTTLGTNGMDNLTALGTHGQSQLYGLGTNGMNSLTTLGTNGMTNLVTLGNNAIDSVENTGIQGMINIRGNTTDWLGYLNKSDLIMQDMLEANGCTITTDSNNKVVVTCN